MINGWIVFFIAMFVLAVPGTLIASTQEEEPRYLSEETIRLSDELAKNPPKPKKQLSDSELSELIEEAELQAKASLIQDFEHYKKLIDTLSIVDAQIEQTKELRADLEVEVQELENSAKEIIAANPDPAILKKHYREFLAEIRKTVDECFAKVKKDVLLPHQQASFDAIYTQHLLSSLQSSTAGRASWSRVLGKFLKLTPQEMAQLKEATEKASQELAETKQNASQNAAKQVVAALPEQKRSFVVELGYDNLEALAWLLKIAKN